jgi:hypothetical protein
VIRLLALPFGDCSLRPYLPNKFLNERKRRCEGCLRFCLARLQNLTADPGGQYRFVEDTSTAGNEIGFTELTVFYLPFRVTILNWTKLSSLIWGSSAAGNAIRSSFRACQI